jgi:selenocysteine-specific elongation factor
MAVIGTAGHVDHGKSTLVQALTGRDPDRWAEEKRRGLTIDLGFAWTALPGGVEVSFVDVPGHERFIKNMLAGIEAIDVALLVVAADEGWMPQSEEHLAVLDLLGVSVGVVALTKVDRVDPDLIGLARLEVEERLAGTSLAGSPIVEVATPVGLGVGMLSEALAEAVTRAGPSPDRHRPRLWVDRVFTIGGAGTVVTGTLLDGTLHAGDRLTVWPGRIPVRVRGLQVHETDHPVARPGYRTAINLAGVRREQLSRGAMLGKEGQWLASRRLVALLRPARYHDRLTGRGAYQVHVGSGGVPARIRLLHGADGAALVTLERALPLTAGDRFVLRETGRRQVVGGGTVLDPAPKGTIDALSIGPLAEAVMTGPEAVAAALLGLRRREQTDVLEAHSGGGRVPDRNIAAGTALSDDEIDRLRREALQRVHAHHDSNPLRPGIPAAQLAGELGVGLAVLDALIAADSELELRGADVALTGFLSTLDSAQEARWQEAASQLNDAGLAVPSVSELGIDPELLHAVARSGRVVLVDETLAYLPDQVEQIEDVLRQQDGPFTVAQARDALGLSRKYVVPLLEWLDRRGFTRRNGDLRTVR